MRNICKFEIQLCELFFCSKNGEHYYAVVLLERDKPLILTTFRAD